MRNTFFTCLAVCLSMGSPVNAQDDQGSVLYSAGTVYTMSGAPLSPGQVLIRDGKIAAVGATLPADTVGDATQVELGPDSVLMPGFIDAYTQTGMESGKPDEQSKEVTPRFQAIHAVDWKSDGIQKQLHDGTTTMCICPGTENVIAGISGIVKTAGEHVINDNHALVASLCSDPASRNSSRQRPDSIYVRQPTNRMGVVWILRNTLSKESRDLDAANPVDQVLEGKRPLFMVSRVSHDLTTVATLADEFDLQPVVVGGQESYLVTDLLAERKYPVILSGTTTGSMFGPEQSKLCWNQAGILDAADIPFAISGSQLLEQARFACRFGLEREKALQAITVSPAKILGIDNKVGTIETGKDADLVALNGDPLEFTTAIEWVMVDGKIQDGQNTKRESKGN